MVSSDHPELSGPPATEEATKARKGKVSSGKGKNQRKREHYTTFDVVEIIRCNKIKPRLELINLALRQKEEGKTVLAEFIANRGQKIVNEALNLAKEFDEAPQTLAQMRKSRVQLLKEAYSGECVSDCNGKWLECGLMLLRRNEIPLSRFCNAMLKALSLGRGKRVHIWSSKLGKIIYGIIPEVNL